VSWAFENARRVGANIAKSMGRSDLVHRRPQRLAWQALDFSVAQLAVPPFPEARWDKDQDTEVR
jgi:hypothetical protein